jgi:hypothetical protein
MLERELTHAQKSENKIEAVRLSGALLPTHPEKLNYLYSALLPDKHVSDKSTFYYPSTENRIADLILSEYDPAYATRMWEIAADNSRGVWQRYYAALKLAKIDPLNNKWDGIALEIIAHHDFAKDPNLSFSMVGGTDELDAQTQIKERFKNLLLKKIQKCSESSCPARLLGDVLTPREALAVIAEGGPMPKSGDQVRGVG